MFGNGRIALTNIWITFENFDQVRRLFSVRHLNCFNKPRCWVCAANINGIKQINIINRMPTTSQEDESISLVAYSKLFSTIESYLNFIIFYLFFELL